MKIVTGYTGTPHVSSNDDQGRNQGIFGNGSCVLNIGNNFSGTMPNATSLSISDGEGIIQGVHFRVAPGTVDSVSIAAGTSGYNRVDIVCARYTKDSSTGIESVDWYVHQGTPSASTPTEPTPVSGDILAGDLVADFPMFKVSLSGVTPTLTKLWNFAVGESKYWSGQSFTLQPSPNTGSTYTFRKTVDEGLYCVTAHAGTSLTAQNQGIECTIYVYAPGSNGISVKAREKKADAKQLNFYLNCTGMSKNGSIEFEVSNLSAENQTVSGTVSVEITRIK